MTRFSPRAAAVVLAGAIAFLDLYSPQAVLPLVAAELGASIAETSLTITASTLAVALVAPVIGALADRFGRKRMIVIGAFGLVIPILFGARAESIETLIAWRFVQGLFMPAVFAGIVAYIGEEWPAEAVPPITSLYVSGAVAGGFTGRFVSGLVAEHFGWRAAFDAVAALVLLSALLVFVWLPRERKGQAAPIALFGTLMAHLRNPRLVATYAVGFCVLFSQVATFTYVNFHLAAPPFNLSPAELGTIFVIYLVGMVVTPIAGRFTRRLGRRLSIASALAAGGVGLALTLVPSLTAVILGLTLSSTAIFVAQATATSYIPTVITIGRSAAVGLYLTFYYIGGSAGAIAPSPAFHFAGWDGAVALILVVQGCAIALAWRAWRPEYQTPTHEAAA